MKQTHNISECVRGALETYFRNLEGEKPAAVYEMVIKNVELSMFEVVLENAEGNQSLAAKILGINRNTLRRKMAEYKLL